MLKKVLLSSLILGSLVLSGCSTTNSIPYKASTANIIKMQQVFANSANKVNVGTVTTAEGVSDSPMCRLMGPIKVAPGKSTVQYIQDALQEEMFMAQIYDPTSSVTINTTLTDLSFSSITPANWTIAMDVSSSNGINYAISTKYQYDTSFDAYSACKNVADAFGPAVQDLIQKMVTHPDFAKIAS